MKSINFSSKKEHRVKTNPEKSVLETEKLELEKAKLAAEIKKLNEKWYKTPAFYVSSFPVLITLIAATTGWATGFFNNQKVLNQIETDKLQIQKDTLQQFVNNQLKERNKLELQLHRLEHVRDSVIALNQLENVQLNELRKTELTKQELIDSVTNFLDRYNRFINNQRAEWDSLENNNRAKSTRIGDLWEQKAISDTQARQMVDEQRDSWSKAYNSLHFKVENDYNTNYKLKLLFYRERLIKYVPKDAIDNYYKKLASNTYSIMRRPDLSMYEYPTNDFGYNGIYEDISGLLSIVKGKKL